ncbi:tetratricopeptide repeat protein [Geobacter sp. OR-1]|uniref:tetratricopeptide repeat protein n=1 Tax=Geobacter sp. OR-1 TaxID=1266765 RepID=UPI000542116E|nr:tetratricopeptide repeat protein [Geobacter sp. OR-1]GAM11066.1 tetratricopeptide repeat protein [Geobacter sp. OR-1]
MNRPTPITGITWYTPSPGTLLEGRDGRASILFDGIPIPLENADFKALAGAEPDYDMVGRGIYSALRTNPDCSCNTIYATWLRDAYPHLLAELASHILMLDHKEVDVSYLDRKINYMKVMFLLEPDNAGLAAEIGAACLDRGLRMSSLLQCTVMLYRAEKYLEMAVDKTPDDLNVRLRYAEVQYLLGRYENASRIWGELRPLIERPESERLLLRTERILAGKFPKIPPVDYLEAIGVAFACFQSGDVEECAAILADVLDDQVFIEDFPMPEVWHHLGLCYQNLAMPKNAAECFTEALNRDPGYDDARKSLDALAG